MPAKTLHPKTELCPRCRKEMRAIVIGKNELRECPSCEGIWATSDALRQICDDDEQQDAVLGLASPMPHAEPVEKFIRYLPCPTCGEMMNRVNFAHCSQVIVDVCLEHGTWFDRDELQRIVEFIRATGLSNARAREFASGTARLPGKNQDYWNLAIPQAASFLKNLLK